MTALSQDLIRELFDYRKGKLINKVSRARSRKGEWAGCTRHDGYRIICISGSLYLEHRLIWLWHYGELPDEIDHIDRNPANNRIGNLRALTHSQNLHNNKGRGTARQSNSWRWTAKICVRGKRIHIGTFDTEEEAHQAYLVAKAEYIGS